MTRERGTTLVELAITALLAALLAGIVYRSIEAVSRSVRFTRARARLASVADLAVRSLAHDARFASHIVARDEQFESLLPALEPAGLAWHTPVRLPVATALGLLDRDTPDGAETGNELACVQPLDHRIVGVESHGDVTEHDIGIVRLVVYAVVRRADGRLDLGRWGSVPLGDFDDLSAIEESKRREAAAEALFSEGIEWWIATGAPLDEMFHRANRRGRLSRQSKIAKPAAAKVPAEPEQIVTGMLRRSGMHLVDDRGSDVASLPRFLHPSDGLGHGFEVRTDGSEAVVLGAVRLWIGLDGGRDEQRFAASRTFTTIRD